jgi:hypothetical protein
VLTGPSWVRNPYGWGDLEKSRLVILCQAGTLAQRNFDMDVKSFNSLDEVLPYLKQEEYKISRRTLFRAVKEAKLRPDSDGTFSKKNVEKYARTWLQVSGTLMKKSDQEIARQRAQKDLQLKEEELKIKKYQRERLEGLYVARSELALELASRAAVFEALLKGEIEGGITEAIALVNGDEKKTGELLRALLEMVDRGLSQYATTKTWNILFIKDEAIEAVSQNQVNEVYPLSLPVEEK